MLVQPLNLYAATAANRLVRDLERENKELRRANEILKRASAAFVAELDRPLGDRRVHRRQP